MQLFGVSYFKVYMATLHAGTHTAARPVPPAVASFRITPEKVDWLSAFINRPEITQTLATNHGAREWISELTLKPEKLWRAYDAAVPEALGISRSMVLQYLQQKCFRLHAPLLRLRTRPYPLTSL